MPKMLGLALRWATASHWRSATSMASYLQRTTKAVSSRRCSSARGAGLVALGVQHGGKAAQGLCVEAVGLGQPARTAREVTRLARIDHQDVKARGGQRQGQILLVAPVPSSSTERGAKRITKLFLATSMPT